MSAPSLPSPFEIGGRWGPQTTPREAPPNPRSRWGPRMAPRPPQQQQPGYASQQQQGFAGQQQSGFARQPQPGFAGQQQPRFTDQQQPGFTGQTTARVRWPTAVRVHWSTAAKVQRVPLTDREWEHCKLRRHRFGLMQRCSMQRARAGNFRLPCWWILRRVEETMCHGSSSNPLKNVMVAESR